jgi:hypothetical protein
METRSIKKSKMRGEEMQFGVSKESRRDGIFIAVTGEIDLKPIYGRQANYSAPKELKNFLSSRVL